MAHLASLGAWLDPIAVLTPPVRVHPRPIATMNSLTPLHWIALLVVVIVGASIANLIQLKRQGCL